MVTEESTVTAPVSRLSVPVPGRTLIGTVERWNDALSFAHSVLTKELTARPSAVAAFDRAFTARTGRRYSPLPVSDHPQLASAALLSIWLVSRIQNPKRTSIRDSEHWFTGTATGLVTAEMNADALSAAQSPLAALPSGSVLDDILPYILESLEHATLPGERSRLAYRKARRPRGVYYTPSDVSDYVAGVVLSSALECTDDVTCLDPACGSGIFLRSALDFLSSKTSGSAADICTRSLFGFDISPLSVLATSFVLLSRVLMAQRDIAETPRETWLAIRRNFVNVDATTVSREPLRDNLLSTTPSLSELFPSVASGFTAVLGNPPYTTLPQDDSSHIRARLFSAASARLTGGTPAYPVFAEMMWRLTRSGCASAGMVLPLSVAYHSGRVFSTLRREMRATSASWRFHFFDRTPDSLFGDDVKTRNAIAFMFRNGAPQSIATSSLRRWNSRTRQELFRSLPTVRLRTPEIGPFVPKLGSEVEQSAYSALASRRQLGELFRKSKSRVDDEGETGSVFHHYSTAYNWLPILRRRPGATTRSGRRTVSSSLRTILCRSPDDASYAFAVLSSRLTYWLWRVECDGFHLTSAFLQRVPLHPSGFEADATERLCDLGSALWTDMEQNPVFATNAGLTTENFSPMRGTRYLDAIDVVLVEQCGLPREFSAYLRQYQSAVIDAERQEGPG